MVKKDEIMIPALGLFSKLDHKMLIGDIFAQLDCKDLLLCQGVSSAFYVILNDDRLWKDIFLNQVKGTKKQIKYISPSWKLTALSFLYCGEKVDSNGNTIIINGESSSPSSTSISSSIETFPFKPIHVPTFQSMEIYTRWLRRHTAVTEYYDKEIVKFVERRDVGELSLQDFIDRYERHTIPVIFTGVQKDWPAMNGSWSKDKLVERFGDITFKITHNSHKRIPMTFCDYANYMATQCDEEPLYVFDDAFGEKAPEMLKDYSVPSYFPEDLFEVSGQERPHFRWLVIGPPRSGAPWHIDPAGTSAWNSLISGRKRWLMYPPSYTPIGVAMEDIEEKFYGSPASLLWLLEVYPYLAPDQKPIEVIQNPGETIFIPGGWWHMVLNLEESIAVTQNFCDSQNFNNVCEELSEDPKKKEYNNFKEILLNNRPEYKKLFDKFEITRSQVESGFDNMEIWEPRIKEVYSRHFKDQSNDFQITSPISGQSPVFIVNNQHVVKFYCTEFGGDDAFLNEVHMLKLVSNDSDLQSIFPSLLASGYYVNGTTINYCDNIKWKWPYIISTFVQGINLQEIQIVPEQLPYPYPPIKELDEEMELDDDDDDDDEELPPIINEKILIDITSKMLTKLHSIEPLIENNPFIKDSNDLWSTWKKELKELKFKYNGNHWNWGGMPIQLRHQMESYLPSNFEDLLDGSLKPCYIHGDLTDENILGDIIKQEEKKKTTTKNLLSSFKKKLKMIKKIEHRKSPHPASIWTPKHMIDFGDSNFGDRFYELISLHLSVFAGDKQRFRQFLSQYRFSQRDGPDLQGQSWLSIYQRDPSAFIYRAMCYTLIHHCDAMTTITRHYPTYRTAQTIKELADLIWNIDIPNPQNKQD